MKTDRLLSLDVLRGITVAGMILVNNPGDWGTIYSPLKHAEWIGLTPTDLVFPFFMFVMGVSMSISMKKFSGHFCSQFVIKLFKRTVILFLLGVMLSWFSLVLDNILHPSKEISLIQVLLPLHDVRILGVLQRLALSYFFASLLAIWIRSKAGLLYTIISILLIYGLVLWYGNGFELSEGNIIAVIDRCLLGENHMYLEWLPDGGRIRFDPEGFLSTLPGIAHVLIGYFCGNIIMQNKTLYEKIVQLSVIGIILLFMGFLFSYSCPIIKKVWSPTYVLVTSGFTYLFFVLLIWIIDLRKCSKWIIPFQALGCNPLFIYLFASLMADMLGQVGLHEEVYAVFVKLFNPSCFSSMMYAIAYVSVNAGLAYILYKKRVFIKL